MQKKGLGLLIAAVAAYSIYRIAKMSPEEKAALKEKGKKFLKENFELGNFFPAKTSEQAV
ncbi:MAG: hypothetical protein J0I84_22370 [Terrimonas sp.]|uniref:hypothetical protein n=1 Tax=Terrimonas sp. TaxID=1914338 RepID=UPI00092CC079|nr:hypothetical protein [Terrimonas sp.]MBN8789836.1 hypothetical protein [Terrimonas sp.]OJY98147.1 MAG: hypothetical protein BGP13_10890 [Sphingobacteriales bacterium 40-81]PVD50546.1 hypothetical protein DC498_19160 [Terrimonas sp.]